MNPSLMNPSPTFLESLKPHERYELLQKARKDPSCSAGAVSRTPSSRVSSISRRSASSKQAALDSAGGVQRAERPGNNESRDVSLRPPAVQGCTKQLEEWSETLSRDNVALASEVMQLRTMLAGEKENSCVLGERVDKLQDLYVESFVDQDSLHSTRQAVLNSKLEKLATPEVLAITRPPATFPVPVPHEQQCTNPSALQVEKLRRHLVSTETSLASTVAERDSLAVQLEDSQVKRKAEKAAYQKQAADFSSKMLGTMRRLVYAADQISKKDESIKSLQAYIHRLEQQSLLLRRTSNKSHARMARRCHSQDTRAVRTQMRSTDSAGSSDCNAPEPRLPFAGAKIQRAASCTLKREQHSTATQRGSPQLLVHDDVALQQFTCTHGQGSWEAQTSPRNRGRTSPTSNSYALQLQNARAARHKGDYGGAGQSSQHDPSGLTPVAEGEFTAQAWHPESPSVVSAAGTSGDLVEEPSLGIFGGSFGTTSGNQVRSTADSDTWHSYMAAIDEMEQRINALDFPSDIDSKLLSSSLT